MKFRTMDMKKHLIIVLAVVITASLLTVPVFAAGFMDGLRNFKTNSLEAAQIIFVICAIGIGGFTYFKTRSKPGTFGVVIFFMVLYGFAKDPDILTNWGTEIAGWFN